jgi:hypothetical protein
MELTQNSLVDVKCIQGVSTLIYVCVMNEQMRIKRMFQNYDDLIFPKFQFCVMELTQNSLMYVKCVRVISTLILLLFEENH